MRSGRGFQFWRRVYVGLLACLMAVLCFGGQGLLLLKTAGDQGSINEDAALYGYIVTRHAQVLRGEMPLNPWFSGSFYPEEEALALTESHFLASIFAYPVLRLLKDPFVAIVVTSLLAYVLLLILTFNWSYGQSGGSVLCACLTTLLLGTSPAIRAHMIRPFFWCLPLLLLVLLLSLRHLKKPSIPRSLAFGFALGLLPWASSHGTVFAVGMLLVLGVVHLVADRALVGWAVVRGLPGLALAAILGFYPMFKQWRAVNGATAGVGDVRGADEGFTLLEAAEWMDRAGVGHFHSTIQWSGIASVAFVIIGILTARGPRVSGDPGSAHPSSFILHPSSFITAAVVLMVIGFGHVLSLFGACVLLLLAVRRGAHAGIVSGIMIASVALACTSHSEGFGMGQALCIWPGGSAVRDPTRWLIPYLFGMVLLAWHADWTRRTVQGIGAFAVVLMLFIHVDPRGIHDQVADGMCVGAEQRWAPREVDIALLSLPPGPLVEVPMGPGDGMLLPSTLIHGRKIVNGYARFLPKAHRVLSATLSKGAKAIPPDVLQRLQCSGVHTWVLDKQKLRHLSDVAQSLIAQGLTLRFEGREHLIFTRDP